jgi:hypothetical protein
MSPSPRTAAIDRVDRVHYQRADKQPPGHSTIPHASHTCSPRCQICGRLCSFRAIRARARIIVHMGGSRDRHWRWRMTLDDHESHVTLCSTVPFFFDLYSVFTLPHSRVFVRPAAVVTYLWSRISNQSRNRQRQRADTEDQRNYVLEVKICVAEEHSTFAAITLQRRVSSNCGCAIVAVSFPRLSTRPVRQATASA